MKWIMYENYHMIHWFCYNFVYWYDLLIVEIDNEEQNDDIENFKYVPRKEFHLNLSR
jgi:hypothetical protein